MNEWNDYFLNTCKPIFYEILSIKCLKLEFNSLTKNINSFQIC